MLWHKRAKIITTKRIILFKIYENKSKFIILINNVVYLNNF